MFLDCFKIFIKNEQTSIINMNIPIPFWVNHILAILNRIINPENVNRIKLTKCKKIKLTNELEHSRRRIIVQKKKLRKQHKIRHTDKNYE